MATRKKNGGRLAGTRNKSSMKVIEKLQELNCDPIEALVTIAKQAYEQNDLTLSASIYRELAGYTAAKLRPIEQTNESSSPKGIRVTIVDA